MTAEDDFEEFQAAPAPLCVPIPSCFGGAQTHVGNASVFGSRGEPLPASLFSSEEPEDDGWGEFSAVRANGTSHPQPVRHQQGAPPPAPPLPPPLAGAPGSRDGLIAKGDPVWYFDGRSHSWVEAKVASVDHTITPPSFGVELRSGAFRETELHRLQPRSAGTPPPSAPVQAPSPPAPGPAPASPGAWAVEAASIANGHTAPPAALQPPMNQGLPPAAAAENDGGDDFGDFAAALPAPALAAAAPSPAGLPAAAPPPAPPPTAAPLAAPASPFMAQASPPASSPAPGSPGPAPSRHLSAGSSSPALERFRSFLHAAAPEVADRLEAEERRQQQQAQELAADEFGDFADAGLPPSLSQHEQPGQQGPLPGGVQRCAPLPLDLFGGQDVEDAPLELGHAAAAPAAGVSAVAAAPSLVQQQQETRPVSPAAPPQPPQAPADPPSTMRDPAGRLLAVDYAANFVRQPPAAPRAPSPPPAPAASHGWGDGDDAFDDFVGAEGSGRGQELESLGLQQPQQLPSPARTSPPHTPPPAGVQRGAALPEDLFAVGIVESEAVEGGVPPAAEHVEPDAAQLPSLPAQAETPETADVVPQPPNSNAGAAGIAQPVGDAGRAATVDSPSGDWQGGDDDGFDDFVAAADPALQAAVAAPAVAVPGREDGAASPPALPGGVQRCAPLPLDLFGGQDVEDAPLELGHAAAAPAPHPGPEQAAAPLEPAPPHTEEQPSVHSEAAALPAQAHSAVVGSEAAQVAGAAGAAVVSNAARTAWEEDADDGFATEGAARATSAGQQALQAGGAWGEVAGSELPALAAGRPGSGLAVQEAAAALHAGGAPPMPTPASAGAAPADGAAEDAASLSHGGDAPSSEAADPLHTAHPAGSQGGSSAPAASSSAWQQLGGGLLPRVPTPSSGAGLALAATPGEEAVTEYGLAWARLLQAAAHLLQASAAVWGEATTSGAWRRQLEQGEGQAHLAACAWLYCAAATVRLAAQQLGLFGLVPELQEAWGQAEAAWQCLPPQPAGADDGGEAEVAEADARQEEAASADQQAQPPFGEACLSASRAWAAAGEGAAAGFSDAAAVLQLLEGAPQRLQGLDPDDFPRLLEWSGGLCGLTLLPLSLFEGHLPVEAWVHGRPCLVPLANLWVHRVSHTPPQLD